MSRIKYHNGQSWVYADMAVQVGSGISYDVTISGTATGDVTNLVDWTGATYTAKTSVPSMLAKIRSVGKIDFDGGLTKDTTGRFGLPVTQYHLPNIAWCEIMSAESFALLAQSAGLTSDGQTEAVVVWAQGMGADGTYSQLFAVVIGVLEGGTTVCVALS